jgi:hypothetical protein
MNYTKQMKRSLFTLRKFPSLPWFEFAGFALLILASLYH